MEEMTEMQGILAWTDGGGRPPLTVSVPSHGPMHMKEKVN